jgi:hypothetical protein
MVNERVQFHGQKLHWTANGQLKIGATCQSRERMILVRRSLCRITIIFDFVLDSIIWVITERRIVGFPMRCNGSAVL